MMDLDFLGKECRVTAAIRKGGAGEVMLNLPSGGSQAFPARASDPTQKITAGTKVYVVDQVGRTVYVTER